MHILATNNFSIIQMLELLLKYMALFLALMIKNLLEYVMKLKVNLLMFLNINKHS